ncbi:hypothetical protein ACEK07_46650 [Alcanivoracaceae bacterium MT1]
MSDWNVVAWVNVGLFVVAMLVLFGAILEAQCGFFLDGTGWREWLRMPAFYGIVVLDLIVIVELLWIALEG